MASYGPAADVYSATIVIWQLLSLEPLYQNINVFEIMEKVSDKKEGLRPPIPKAWHKDLKRIIESGWHHEPRKRPTASELNHQLQKFASRCKGDTFSHQERIFLKKDKWSIEPAGELMSPPPKSPTLETLGDLQVRTRLSSNMASLRTWQASVPSAL